MSIPEQRFRDGQGIKYLKNGKIMCHALSKSRMRKWREDFDDYDTPSEDLWPECQCHKAAIDGQFVCGYHGGLSPRTKNPPRTIIDVMPFDMAENYRRILENPDYISRKEDILLIKARQWELLEELQIETGSEEAWGLVHEALVNVKKGNEVNAIDMLERALKSTERKQQIWSELYQTEKLLSDLTSTQVKTAKELRLLATHEQVNSLIANIIHILTTGIDVYIDDPGRRVDYKQSVINEIQKLGNLTPRAMIVDQT